jgi:hypothetical protein
VIVTDDERVIDYVAKKNGTRFYPPFTSLGIDRGGRIVAGVVFNCFTGKDIAVTIAGEPGAFTKAFIELVGRYVFVQLGCLRISITTEQEKIIDFAHRLGGQTEGRKRDLYGKGRDGTILGILHEHWKV